MKTIVVGYDGSEPSKRALRRAADLAQAFKAKLTVLSVTEPLPAAGDPLLPADGIGIGAVGLPPIPDTAEAERELNDAQAALRERDLEVEYESTLGDAATALVDAAESRQADLIVVGSRHPGFLDRLLSGDVGEAVSRRSRCDVLIVH